MSGTIEVAKHLCAAAQDDWSTGKAYWMSLANEVLAIAYRERAAETADRLLAAGYGSPVMSSLVATLGRHGRDRDAAPREREAVEAEGQQPGPIGIAK